MSTTAEPPSILVVDDDEGLLILMAGALRSEGFEVAMANSARTAGEWLESHTPDLMLLDLKLKDRAGPELVTDLQRKKAFIPFVVVTGQGDEKVAVEIMKQGALDYVMKDMGLIDLLPQVVRRALASVGQSKALTAAQAEHRRLEREILEVGERERHSIGADLHDGLGQQLTAIELTCAMLKVDAAGHPALAKGLDHVGRMLREAIAQTRFLARGLVPVGSEPDALQVGLLELTSRVNALGKARCVFDSPKLVNVTDPAAAGHLYRIAQEGVNNAIKHSNARRVTVRLVEEGDAIVLEIVDDGTGLTRKGTGVGLGVMQHRAKVIGADLQIDSKRGAGVAILCRLPRKR